MKQYTANVIIPDDVYPDRLVALLEDYGYATDLVGNYGVIVQGKSSSLQTFVETLERRIPNNAIIDDFGEAA